MNHLSGGTAHVFGMDESVGAFGNSLCDSRWHRSACVFLLAPDGEEDRAVPVRQFLAE